MDPIADLHRLSDDTVVLIRPIRPDDAEELDRGVRRLSAASNYKRFLSPKPRLTKREQRYLTEIDFHDHVAFVAESTQSPGMILAAARYIHNDTLPAGVAEAAIVVADPLQGLGLGGIMADYLARAAAANGVERFTAEILADNHAAKALMRKLERALAERAALSGRPSMAPTLAA